MSKRLIVPLLGTLLALTSVMRPVQAQGGVTYSTGIQVQNLESQQASVVLTFHQGSTTYTHSDTIPENGSKTFFPLPGNVPSGFSGAAVVSSDRNVRAVVNQLGTLAGTTFLATTNGFQSGSTQLSLPLIMCNNNGYNTWFSVQNAGTSEAPVFVSYISGASVVASENVPSVLPGAAVVFDQGPSSTGVRCESGLPATFVGSAIVTSTQPIVASVMQLNTTNFKTLLGYNGFTGGSSSIALPLVMSNNSGFFTGIQVQNAGTTSTTVYVQYGPDTTPGDGFTGPSGPEIFTLAPGASKTIINNGNAPGNGSSFNWTGRYVGSAIITNTQNQPLVAIVNQLRTTGTPVGTAYEGFDPSTATQNASAPLIMANNSGYFTGIQVQNVGSTPVSVTITYGPDTATGDGAFSAAPENFSLGPGQSRTILQSGTSPANGSVNNWASAGTYIGSAQISASGPIVAIVNQLNLAGSGDTFATGTAFNY